MELAELFSFKNLYNSYLKCCKGVNWKTSTKNFRMRAIQKIADLREKLINKTYKSSGFSEFNITERGKTRQVKAVHICERIVQKCMCDYWLYPLLSRRLIYDNGATLKGKGLSFALRRTKCHLQRYWRKHGTNGYVLTFDFSKFFDSIDHERLKSKIAKLTTDTDIFNLYCQLVDNFGQKGLGLGSQISQISALFYLSDIDHALKEQLRCKHYLRYMDDGFIIESSKKRLENILLELTALSKAENIPLNAKKTKIERLIDFKFLKRHWTITRKGYVKVKPFHQTLLRLKRRFVKIRTKAIQAINQFKASVNGLLKIFRNRRIEAYVFN